MAKPVTNIGISNVMIFSRILTSDSNILANFVDSEGAIFADRIPKMIPENMATWFDTMQGNVINDSALRVLCSSGIEIEISKS